MTVLICPGIHPPELTRCFLAGLGRQPGQDLVFPADRYPAYSAYHIWQFLQDQMLQNQPLQNQEGYSREILLVGFSAGVVGAMGAAALWQGLSGIVMGNVKALIALDGWGVPLAGNFPIYRISHDPFTHWSSNWLGGGREGFYADPPVSHLDLWQFPQRAKGWWVASGVEKRSPYPGQTGESKTYTTAGHFLSHLLQRYGEI